MSVINQMLRDLDKRSATPAQSGLDVARGTHSLHLVGAHAEGLAAWRRPVRWLFAVMIVGAVILSGALLSRSLNPLARAPAPVVAAPPIRPSADQPSAAGVPLTVPDVPVLQLALTPSRSLAIPAPAQTAQSAAMAQATPPTVAPTNFSAPTASQAAAPASPPLLEMSKSLALPTIADAPLAHTPGEKKIVPEVPPATERTARPNHPVPALEALAQAQTLWNAGGQEAALALVQEALVAVEREAASAGAASPPHPVLISLARELARMNLAQGSALQALAVLTRLEPVLANDADAWALRGNATQRLGQHEAAVAAYLTALKLQPGESRWMLGAAVSLAAMGQTAQAAQWADRARLQGGLHPDIAQYLRQLGVPI